MASRSLLLLLAVLYPLSTAALQVTPNSQCSSLCIDTPGLDLSDPNSSSTSGDDITCQDKSYATSPFGQKFQKCVSCLQNSTAVQGKENDQMWFLYNLRYSFDYCIFGFPNATGVASTPCSTSTACGGLETALKDGNLDPKTLNQYGYCSADGSAMLGPSYQKCLACMRASGDQLYLANFLVALEAGCQQQPIPGKIVGLNETVFSKTPIDVVDPNTVPIDAPKDNSSSHMSSATIIGIAAGTVIILLLFIALLYILHRKKKAKMARLNPFENKLGNEGSGGSRRHRPQSSLSFRCKNLSPTSPKIMFSPDDSMGHTSPIDSSRIQKLSQLRTNSPAPPQSNATSPVSPHLGSEKGGAASIRSSVQLHKLATGMPTAPPAAASRQSTLQTPGSGGGLGLAYSPIDESITPSSAMSSRSTAALLPAIKQYVPSDYRHIGRSPSNPGQGPQSAVQYNSPSSASTASPMLSTNWSPVERRANPFPWDKPSGLSAPVQSSAGSFVSTATTAATGMSAQTMPPMQQASSARGTPYLQQQGGFASAVPSRDQNRTLVQPTLADNAASLSAAYRDRLLAHNAAQYGGAVVSSGQSAISGVTAVSAVSANSARSAHSAHSAHSNATYGSSRSRISNHSLAATGSLPHPQLQPYQVEPAVRASVAPAPRNQRAFDSARKDARSMGTRIRTSSLGVASGSPSGSPVETRDVQVVFPGPPTAPTKKGRR